MICYSSDRGNAPQPPDVTGYSASADPADGSLVAEVVCPKWAWTWTCLFLGCLFVSLFEEKPNGKAKYWWVPMLTHTHMEPKRHAYALQLWKRLPKGSIGLQKVPHFHACWEGAGSASRGAFHLIDEMVAPTLKPLPPRYALYKHNVKGIHPDFLFG